MTNIQKASFALTIIGITGIIASGLNNSSNKIFRMEQETVRKLFIGTTMFGGIILTISSLSEMRK